MRHRGWRAGLLVLVMALTSCGQGATAKPVPAPEPAKVFPAWKGCEAHVPPLDLVEINDRTEQGLVPDGFSPTRAVQCEEENDPETDQSRGVELQADDIDGLLAELARPSETLGGGTCLDYLWRRPWLFLLDADGRWIIPQVPADACGHRRLTDDQPTWKRVTTWPLDLSERERLWSIGCQPRVLVDGILTDPAVGNEHREAIPAAQISGRVTALCRYRIGPRLHPNMMPEGHLISPQAVTPQEGQLIRSAIISEPANRCREVATTFVTLEGVGDMIEVAVELDGCRRMLETYSADAPHRAGAASPELLALVGG